MNKRKIAILISLVAISLSAVMGFTVFNKSSEPETIEEPKIPEEPQIAEKPKFHISDINFEYRKIPNGSLTIHDLRISFKLQNLGNVTANQVVVGYDIKLSGSSEGFWRLCSNISEDFIFDGETFNDNVTIKFLWIRGNVTINNIESKETNEYYIKDLWHTLREIVGDPARGMILESYWVITCAEDVTETFEFY